MGIYSKTQVGNKVDSTFISENFNFNYMIERPLFELAYKRLFINEKINFIENHKGRLSPFILHPSKNEFALFMNILNLNINYDDKMGEKFIINYNIKVEQAKTQPYRVNIQMDLDSLALCLME